MDIPSQVSTIVPTARRGVTTAVGSVFVTMAGLGFLGSLFVMLAGIFGSRTTTTPHDVLLINSAFSLLSKGGLLVLGIFLLRRHPQARVAAAAGLGLSSIDSVYFLVAVVPPMRASVDTALAGVFNFGAWVPAVMSLLLYVGIFVYLGQPAARQEFGRTNG